MAILLKCKMCGGDISVNAEMTVGTCQYCGSTMTIPHIDSDKKARLFNWANQLRLNNEFDKAYDAYKEIVSEDTEEAEAYWGMILSEYGVEYVEDPKTKKRVPTCHRTIDQPIKKSANYEMACKYADIENRFMYQNEADVLDKIQKKIMSISSRQEQYDVFICYKESEDNSTDRTDDSVIAQEIYDELTKKGMSTFFARITLKDKLGEDYEPYIYSALKTAKVMVVVTTSSEHCESPWVKNEWARFISFMSEDADKKIIPVFKNMTAYELPDELTPYQAQDLNKVGAVQDLVLGIESLLRSRDTTKKTMSEQDVLSIVKENKIKERQARNDSIIHTSKKVLRVVVPIALAVLLVVGIIVGIKYAQKSYFEPNKTYKAGIAYMNEGKYLNACNEFVSIKEFKNAEELRLECLYLHAEELEKNGKYEEAIKVLSEITSYKDSTGKIDELNKKAADLKAYAENESKFNDALAKFEKGNYKAAIGTLQNLEKAGFEGSAEQIQEMYDSLFLQARDLAKKEDYTSALYMLEYLSEAGYSGADKEYDNVYKLKWDPVYNEANMLYENKLYIQAMAKYGTIEDSQRYGDVDTKIKDCESKIAAEKEPFNGRWIGHGDWWGSDMCFVINNQGVKLAIGRDGDAWIKTTSEFDEERGKLVVKYEGDTYALSVSGKTLTVKHEAGKGGTMAGTYTRIGDK